MATANDQSSVGDAAGLSALAKWLVAGLGGVGAALLSGIQLTKFGDISGTAHVIVAVVAGLLAVGALIAAVIVTVSVILPSTITLGGLRSRESLHPRDYLIKYIHENADEILREDGDTVVALENDYRAALEARHRALDPYYERYSRGTASDADAQLVYETIEEAERLNGVVNALLGAARLQQARHAFRLAEIAIAVLAVTVAAAVIGLSWAANTPDRPALDLRGAKLDGVTLRDVSLKDVVLDGMTIKNADLAGTYLGGASIDGTKWSHVICPDGVLSDNAGHTCDGHLTPTP